tara:strand:+ start:1151 stop:1648 length:498 start_codon:yes stop_codon:yes gene_type:complete
MPLIIKGGKKIEVITKKQMSTLLEKSAKSSDPFAGLPADVVEKRKSILEQKSHREYMGRMEKAREESAAVTKVKLEQATATMEKLAQEKTANAVVETVSAMTVDTLVKPVLIDTKSAEMPLITDIPDFVSMTKKEIDVWADTNLGVQLDRRHTKAAMIEALKKSL